MTRRNRVTPLNEIIADPGRGLFMGNRGVLHDASGVLRGRLWKHRAWICCLTEFKGRRRALLQPRRYTELFFLDEAVALAAGHRPCAECRRADYNRFRAAWAGAGLGVTGAATMDTALHAARLDSHGAKPVFEAEIGTLPDGTFINASEGAYLVRGDGLWPYTPGGYLAPLPRPAQAAVMVLTPRPMVAALAMGYRPILHPSALQ